MLCSLAIPNWSLLTARSTLIILNKQLSLYDNYSLIVGIIDLAFVLNVIVTIMEFII